MVTQLLRHIIFIAVLMTLGVLNLILLVRTPLWWWALIYGIVGVAYCVFAWLMYRRAELIAKVVDAELELQGAAITLVSLVERMRKEDEANESHKETNSEDESAEQYAHPI